MTDFANRFKVIRKDGRVKAVEAIGDSGHALSLPVMEVITRYSHSEGVERVSFVIGGHRVDFEQEESA